MQYVMIVDVPEDILDGDDSIENAAACINHDLTHWADILLPGSETASIITVRPLSEVIAA